MTPLCAFVLMGVLFPALTDAFAKANRAILNRYALQSLRFLFLDRGRRHDGLPLGAPAYRIRM